MRSLLRRLTWLLHWTLGSAPRDPAEEVWRLRFLLARPRRQCGIIIWRGQPLQYADGPALYGQLQDIFVKRVYDFRTTAAAPRIIDCGAHVGVAVLRWRETHPLADITAIEADPAIADFLRRNLTGRSDQTTTVIAAAAWVANTTVNFNVTGEDNGHIHAEGTRQILGCDLAEHCRKPVDLLKLDIEGAEEAVLTHLADSGALRQVRRLVCEWHQWTPEAPGLHLILGRLVRAGFVYRLVEAHCLGGEAAPDFPQLAWPGNHLMLYAWQRNISPLPT